MLITASNSSGVLFGTGIDPNTIWSGTILVVGILLLIAIIVAITIFICYHRKVVKKKQKYQQQLQNQALLVNGEAHTSPSHSASHSSIKGSTNISFGDPAGRSPTHTSPRRKRDYIIPKDSSPSHNKARHIKGYKSSEKRSSKHIQNGFDPGSVTGNGIMPDSVNYSSPHNSRRVGEHAAAVSATPTSVYSISSHGYIPVSTLGSPAHTPSTSYNAPGAGNHTQASPLAHRGDLRNKSFITAVKSPNGPPIAGEEDLSPISPTAENKSYPGGQYIPMEAYYNVNNPTNYDSVYNNSNGNKKIAETAMYSPHTKHKYISEPVSPFQELPGKRPPVEGRDSNSRRQSRYVEDEQQKSFDDNVNNVNSSQYYSSRPSSTNPHQQSVSNFSPYANSAHAARPEVKPLPLRSIQRPDGQSPDTNTNEARASHHSTPHSELSNLSPVLKTNQLFPEALSKGPSEMDLVMPGENDFEYDDYIPDLPGSYFSMDPHAYTLTWSQNPGNWVGAANNPGKPSSSDSHRQPTADGNHSSMC